MKNKWILGVYYGGTGNSKYVVQVFCSEYDKSVKVLSIEDDNIIKELRQNDMLIFAYLVQYSTVPKILRDFIIENKEFWENKKVQDINKVFDRFYTTDQSRTKKTTGLGLAIVKRFVAQMGGDVNAYLEGNRFTIKIALPILSTNE